MTADNAYIAVLGSYDILEMVIGNLEDKSVFIAEPYELVVIQNCFCYI